MKEYTSDKIRNVAVLSHDGAGKTAVVESLLLACGAVDAVGVGKDNKHIMDYEPEEIKRNVTIQLGIAPCEWEGYKAEFPRYAGVFRILRRSPRRPACQRRHPARRFGRIRG